MSFLYSLFIWQILPLYQISGSWPTFRDIAISYILTIWQPFQNGCALYLKYNFICYRICWQSFVRISLTNSYREAKDDGKMIIIKNKRREKKSPLLRDRWLKYSYVDSWNACSFMITTQILESTIFLLVVKILRRITFRIIFIPHYTNPFWMHFWSKTISSRRSELTFARASRDASASAAIALCNCTGSRTSFLQQ